MNDHRLEGYLLAIAFLLAVNAVVVSFSVFSPGTSGEIVTYFVIAVGAAVVLTIGTIVLAWVIVPSGD